MRKRAVGYAIGKLLQVMTGLLLVPLSIGLWDYLQQGLPFAEALLKREMAGLLAAMALSLFAGSVLVMICRTARHLQGVREGYAIVTLGWLILTFVNSLPLLVWFEATTDNSVLLSFTDAFFEIMSGFTTTGATILSDIEGLPRSLQFLRCLTHWLGGMGIITLAIAIFPAMGVSGYQMFRGEVPGPTKDRLQPRLAQTASILWGVYLLLSLAETILLMVAGMNLFDAVCHTFATMATGGFSNNSASIGGYNSDLIEWVIILFMYFAGINFLLHFKALRGDVGSMFRNREFVFYNGVILVAIVLITGVLLIQGLAPMEQALDSYRHEPIGPDQMAQHYVQEAQKIDGLYNTVRTATFQAVAIITTTGFATADFDIWPDFLRVLLILLMFFGGCAGSTGGGMKMIRVMIVFKVAYTHLRRLSQPRLIAPVKIGGQAVDEGQIVNIVSFFILFVGLFVLVALAMTLFVPDVTTAVACSIATIGNIGPGLAGIGAIENYGWIPIPGKWLLVFSMLLGRLEIFTVLIVLRPSVWKS
jgi:trk system potassium uptake protein TrkH